MASERDQIKELLDRISDTANKGASVGAAEQIVNDTRTLWALFKEMKKPATVTERVVVQDPELVAERDKLREDFNRWKSKLSTMECRAKEVEAALAKLTSSDMPDTSKFLAACDSTGPPGFNQEPTGIHAMILMMNPHCTGCGAWEKLVGDEEWIRSAVQICLDHGITWFLAHMLAILHRTKEYYSLGSTARLVNMTDTIVKLEGSLARGLVTTGTIRKIVDEFHQRDNELVDAEIKAREEKKQNG